VEVARALIDAGADIEYIDDTGFTALMWACEHSELACARLLIDAGAYLAASPLPPAPYQVNLGLVRRFWFAFGCWCILECSGAPLGPRTRGDAHRTRRGEGRSGAERADHDGRHAVAHGV
jgi:ankyrin repeat protein